MKHEIWNILQAHSEEIGRWELEQCGNAEGFDNPGYLVLRTEYDVPRVVRDKIFWVLPVMYGIKYETAKE